MPFSCAGPYAIDRGEIQASARSNPREIPHQHSDDFFGFRSCQRSEAGPDGKKTVVAVAGLR